MHIKQKHEIMHTILDYERNTTLQSRVSVVQLGVTNSKGLYTCNTLLTKKGVQL